MHLRFKLNMYAEYTIILVLLIQCCIADNKAGAQNGDTQAGTSKLKAKTDGTKQALTPEETYQRLLRQKRATHLEAVKTILGLEDYQKQHKMITLLLDKLFKVLTVSQVNLMSMGFSPGDKFPMNETIRDAYSQVIENTAFFGDLILRLPDIVHDVMKKKRDWRLLIQWGVGFCNMAEIYEGKDLRMLNLMSQELGIIEQDPTYINPYKEVNIKASKQSKGDRNKYTKQVLKKQKKKKQKERRKGPRLSSGRSEL